MTMKTFYSVVVVLSHSKDPVNMFRVECVRTGWNLKATYYNLNIIVYQLILKIC